MKPVLSILALAFLPTIVGGQTEYVGDGVPTQRSEEIRWHLNRGRFNPAAENTLRRTSYPGLNPRPPLAPNAILDTAARYHALDMAANNQMSHNTFLNSPYFNGQAHRSNSTSDFYERALDLGYTMNGGAENVAFGYPTALSVYLGWWNSEGHRNNMYSVSAVRREIGTGNGRSGNTDYDAMTLANRDAAPGLFTDTLFRDANSDGVYGSGEGIAGLRIELTNNGVAHTYFDVSSAVGSFAVPLNGINAGNNIQVFLTNPTGAAVTLSIPESHAALETVTIPAGQRWLLGTFVRAAATNAGFRNLTFSDTQPLTVPDIGLSTDTGQAVLSFDSQSGYTYQVQWSADLSPPWNNLGNARTGTGRPITVTDPSDVENPSRRFYRVVITGQ